MQFFYSYRSYFFQDRYFLLVFHTNSKSAPEGQSFNRVNTPKMGTAKSRTARISADELAKRQQSNFEAQKKHIRTTDGRALLVSWLLAGLLTCSYIQLYASDNCIATAVFVFTCILVCEFAKIKHTFKPTKQQNKQTKQTNTHTHTHTHKNCSWYTRL